VSDEEAINFLPPLPPFPRPDDPNVTRRNEIRLKEINNKVLDVLLGARVDGERPRGVVEWGLESYKAVAPGKERKEVQVFRVCGMVGS
jgi:hypothetical protein